MTLYYIHRHLTIIFQPFYAFAAMDFSGSGSLVTYEKQQVTKKQNGSKKITAEAHGDFICFIATALQKAIYFSFGLAKSATISPLRIAAMTPAEAEHSGPVKTPINPCC